MQIKRFEAKNMTSALRLIKKELGSDAVILSARSLKKENKLLGLVRSVGVEVTAAVDSYQLPAETKATAVTGAANAYRRYAQIDRSAPMQKVQPTIGSRIPSRSKRKPAGPSADDMHGAAEDMLSAVFEHLLSQEVKRDLAADIVEHLNERAKHGQLDSIDTIVSEITALLQNENPSSEVRSPHHNGVRVVAVVGSSGVGKTTTVAKLAARHAIEQHQTVALISLDANRIGASAGLKVYAKAIGIPLKIVATPAEFRAAVGRFNDMDLILVDTPGLNPTMPNELDGLRACLGAVEQPDIYLALSAMTKASDLKAIRESLKSMGVAGFIFTKLDESRTHGNLIDLISEDPLPLAYLTNGRQVPDDIETGSLRKVVTLLLSDLKFSLPLSQPLSKDPLVPEKKMPVNERQFVANKNSDIFHCSDCKWTQKIKSKNLMTFSSPEVARMQQFMPCRDCQPEKSKPFQIDLAAKRDSVRISNYS
ncbi:MAG: flagellar biosynthesis protein FlhF [Desulfobacterales bacterium]|jgi:flagellar biosynthesis protein FlhF